MLLALGLYIFLIVFQSFRSLSALQMTELNPSHPFSSIDLTKLTWQAAAGFEPLGAKGLSAGAPGVITLPPPAFPISLNSIFHTPLRSGVHEYTLATSFELKAEDLETDLALSLPELGENWAVYLNGELLRSEVYLDAAGKTMLKRRSAQDVVIPLAATSLQSGTNHLVFRMIGAAAQSSLFPGWAPGFPLANGYVIRSSAELAKELTQHNAVAMFQIGMYYFFGIYQLFFYFHRRKQAAALLLGLFMIGFGSGWQFLNSPFVFSIYTDTSLITRFSYSSAIFAGLLAPMVWYSLYPEKRSPWYLNFILAYQIAAVLVILAAPFEWLEPIFRVNLLLMGSLILFSLWVVVKAWRQHHPDGMLLGWLWSVVALMFGWDLIDIQVLHTGWLMTPFMPFIVSLLFSVFLINRYWHLTNEWERLNQELKERNQELLDSHNALEHQVDLRMAQLTEEVAQRQKAQQEAENRAIEAETLRQAGAAVIETLDLREMVERILEQLWRVVPYDSASVQLKTADGSLSEVVGGHGFVNMQSVIGMLLPLDEKNPATQVYQTHQPRLMRNVPEEFIWFHHPEFTALSWLCVPLLYRGEAIGVLTLDSQEAAHFTDRHVNLVAAFAGPAALALQNAKVYEQVRQYADEQAMFYDIGLTITAGLEMEVLLKNLHNQVRRYAPLDSFFIAIYDEDTQMVSYPIFDDRSDYKFVPARSIVENPGLTGWILKNRKTLYLPDTLEMPEWLNVNIIRAGGEKTRSFVGVPLILGERVVGVISMQSYQPAAYSADQIRLFELMSSQAAVAIENSRLYQQVQQELALRHQAEKLLYEANTRLQEHLSEIQELQENLREQAIRDSLTGLFNRRYLEETLERELVRMQREKQYLGLIMLDIDHFKVVNDTYGHKAGDLVLKSLAELMIAKTRSSDVACRYGGEEFVLVLPGTNLEATFRRAESLREQFENNVVPFGEVNLAATISLGVSVYPEHGIDIDTLIRHADAAMYQAKLAGRNRVVG